MEKKKCTDCFWKGPAISVTTADTCPQCGKNGTIAIVIETPEKEFFWKDLSGGGRTCKFTEEGLLNAFDSEDDVNYDGLTIAEWNEESSVGDTWENSANRVTRTI